MIGPRERRAAAVAAAAVLGVSGMTAMHQRSVAAEQVSEYVQETSASISGGRPTAVVVVAADGSVLGSWSASGNRRPVGGGSRWRCVHHPLAINGMELGTMNADYSVLAYPLVEGEPYVLACSDSDGRVVSSTIMVFDPADPLGPLLLEERVADAALASLDLPAPVIGRSPVADLLVGLETWLWVEGPWEPMSGTAQVGAVSATVVATPVRVVWDLGDSEVSGGDDVVVCDGPGRRYERDGDPSCSYVYRHRSTLDDPQGTFTLGATIEWEVSYATSSGASGDLGLVVSTGDTQVRVLEAQSVMSYD